MHLERAVRHVAFRIEIAVEAVAGRKPVDQLDAADLDQPVALIGIEPGGFGVEHDLAHAGVLSDSPSRQAGNRAQNAKNLCTSGIEGTRAESTMKCARARFSASGIWRASSASSRSAVMPGRDSTRARCTSAGADTTTTASTLLLAAGLEQQRDVEHDHARAARRLLVQKSVRDRAHQRMHDRFEPLDRVRIADQLPGKLARDRSFRRPSRPGNAASTGRDRLAFVEPVHHRVGIVHRHAGLAEKSAVVDLPMPIEPVRPRMNIAASVSALRPDIGLESSRAAPASPSARRRTSA